MGSECCCGGSLAPRSAYSWRGVGSRVHGSACVVVAVCVWGFAVGHHHQASATEQGNRELVSTTPQASSCTYRHRVSTQPRTRMLTAAHGQRWVMPGFNCIQFSLLDSVTINAIAVCLCHVVLGLSHVKTSRPRQQHRSSALLLTEKVLCKFSGGSASQASRPPPSLLRHSTQASACCSLLPQPK